MPLPTDRAAEWLEADGLGGFAMGTVDGVRTRRYHGLLCVATTPPTGRVLLVNGLEAWVDTPSGTWALSSQRYAGGVAFPDGASHLRGFTADPWPEWRWRLHDGVELVHEVLVPRGTPACLLAWRLSRPAPGVALRVRLLCSGRDYHHLHHENPAFRFAPEPRDGCLVWRPYDGIPPVVALASGGYQHAPDWYRGFLYTGEQARGLDCVEDLASPGVFHFDLSHDEATLALGVDLDGARTAAVSRTAERRRRAALASPLHRAADAYVVRRRDGLSLIAGYPWFTDWGRDTFVALRGLCLAGGRHDDACRILRTWAGHVSRGMLPNRFPDTGTTPEYNSVDAALWFAVAVHELLAGAPPVAPRDARLLREAVQAILEGHRAGTRHGIRADDDGLLACGEPGIQLTWMDAKVGERVVTPRTGKPVEVQALWIAALRAGAAHDPGWSTLAAQATAAFERRFWNDARGCLFDVVDVDQRAGTADPALRPNQILAAGGLPWPLVGGERARRVVDVVERELWTPLGLRSLAPGEPGYCGRYQGGPAERDAAYHQGTAWPWLLGPFVDAWVHVHGDDARARREARTRFLAPLLAHLAHAGLGHVSEIADGDPPHAPRGCPFQAWSVGEALRLDASVLAEPADRPGAAADCPVGPAGHTEAAC